jgi:hypothetical protein
MATITYSNAEVSVALISGKKEVSGTVESFEIMLLLIVQQELISQLQLLSNSFAGGL